MKRNSAIAGLIAAVIVMCASSIPAQHMLGPRGPIPLREDSSRLMIKFETTFNPQDREAFLSDLAPILRPIQDDHVRGGFLACSLHVPRSTMHLSDSLRSLRGVYLAEPFYLAPNDTPLIAGETFIVAFRSGISRGTIDSIVSSFGAMVDREMQGIRNIFLLRNTNRSGQSLLDVANAFALLGVTAYACPNFNCPIVKTSYRVFDYYHPHQYHSKKVIGNFNQASVWDFAGLTRPVTVAVIDDGINWQGIYTHFDLPASRVLQGRDFNASPDTSDTNWWDDDPSPGYYEAHGMGCAGIIAASHTTDSTRLWDQTTCTFGLNPHCKILPVKIFNDSAKIGAASQWDLGEAITYAYGIADVLSNSWSYEYPYSLGTFPHLDSALQAAPVLGREGRGCPVIFAAGNTSIYPTGYPARLPWCFAVGATQLNDSLWSYSQHDSTLDVVAPSSDGISDGGVWTLDQMWVAGHNPYDTARKYPSTWHCGSPNNEDINCRFSGTSAACPIVSGVASLLPSRDSMLTAYQVYNILDSSAIPIGSPVPNDVYGYGRVDAFRAVLSISHGDASNDGVIDFSDFYAIMDYLTSNIEPFPSVLLADCNCDGIVDTSDMYYIIDYLYFGGFPPVKPCFAY